MTNENLTNTANLSSVNAQTTNLNAVTSFETKLSLTIPRSGSTITGSGGVKDQKVEIYYPEDTLLGTATLNSNGIVKPLNYPYTR